MKRLWRDWNQREFYCTFWCYLFNQRFCRRPMNRTGGAGGGITAALQSQKWDDQSMLGEYQYGP